MEGGKKFRLDEFISTFSRTTMEEEKVFTILKLHSMKSPPQSPAQLVLIFRDLQFAQADTAKKFQKKYILPTH
jgi:hypothetical protein